MDKEKRIEEMAEDIRLIKELQASNIYTPNYQEAMALISLGYRKIPESSANISKEEYETLQKQLDYWKKETKIAREEGYQWCCKAHKQAIKELIKKLKESEYIKSIADNGYIVSYVKLCQAMDKVAKEMGVE